jgi:hypothetical protein
VNVSCAVKPYIPSAGDRDDDDDDDNDDCNQQYLSF